MPLKWSRYPRPAAVSISPIRSSPGREELRGASFQDDSGMVRDRFVGTHTVYFRPGLLEPDAAPPLEWQDALAEQEYQKFVQQHYLQVPDDLLI